MTKTKTNNIHIAYAEFEFKEFTHIPYSQNTDKFRMCKKYKHFVSKVGEQDLLQQIAHYGQQYGMMNAKSITKEEYITAIGETDESISQV